MLIYLDESGDLGWTFDKPNRNGGSSRFITIAGIVVDNGELKHVKRFIADIYKKYNLTPKQEKKGANFSDEHADYIICNLNKLIAKAPSFNIISITTRKEKVNAKLRGDKNIFYNYMLGVLLPDTIRRHSQVHLTIDRRTIKVQSGNSFEDYIKTKCWGELSIATEINCCYDDSDKNEGIWLADWVANFIWRHYENQRSDACTSLTTRHGNRHFFEKTLFM